MNSMRSEGYTLWLMPKGEVYSRFTDIIKNLATEYGGPVFEPHVTLLGEIEIPEEEVIARTVKLVKDQIPFQFDLEKIDYEDYFFRTLFVRAKLTKPLQSLHNHAKDIFGITNAASYMPHLSLLYGNYPVSLKEKMIKQLGKEQSAQFEVNSVHLMKGGEIKDWKMLGEFKFS